MNTRSTANAVPTDEVQDLRQVEDILRQRKAEAERLERMRKKTAEFSGQDDGDILFI